MRQLVVFTSVLALAVSAACTSSTPAGPSAVDSQPTSSAAASASGGAATSRNDALASLKQATAAFHDVDKAVEAGYLSPAGLGCVASPEGAMGIHAVNPALANDQVIDPLRPEVLLYEPKNGGGFKLVGVEYFQAILLRNKATGAVSPWFAPTPWPAAEYDVLTPRPSVFGQAFDGPMPGHEPGMPWHYDLHVWAWSTNPSGDFAMFNPRVSCENSAN